MRSKVASVIIGLLIAIAVYSFFTLYERITEVVDTGYGEEARKNPYLAAKQYLASLDVPAETSTLMTTLDGLGVGETLFVTNASSLRNQERVDQLLDWVDQGGRLIMAVSDEDVERKSGLISSLGLDVDYIAAAYPEFRNCAQLMRREKRVNNNTEVAVEGGLVEALEELNRQSNADRKNAGKTQFDQSPEECLDRKYLSKMIFTDIESPFYVHFPGSVGLSWRISEARQPFYFVEDDAGIRFAQFDWGDGLITVMTSSKLWQSDRIGLFDNAFLLWALSEAPKPLRILYGSAMPSLLVQIWRTGAEFVITGALAILLWIWYVGKRIRPSREPLVTQRRSVQEHLQARGNYLWKHAEYDALIEPVRADVLQRCKRRYPAFNHASRDWRIEFISTTCDLNIESVRLFFTDGSCKSAAQCEQTIKIAQQIRTKL